MPPRVRGDELRVAQVSVRRAVTDMCFPEPNAWQSCLTRHRGAALLPWRDQPHLAASTVLNILNAHLVGC